MTPFSGIPNTTLSAILQQIKGKGVTFRIFFPLSFLKNLNQNDYIGGKALIKKSREEWIKLAITQFNLQLEK